MLHKYEDKTAGTWDAFIKAMHSGEEVEIDEEMYYYWLEVLPPVFMGRTLGFPDPQHPMRYDFGFAEGAEPITVFWRNPDRTRFFCRRTAILNPVA
jgi:hypothetical protein